MGAAAGAVLGMAGGVLGQLFANTNDARQIKQQDLLNRQQLRMNWEDRIQALGIQKQGQEQLPLATMKGLQAAGLNPALMYGMGGAGATTVTGGTGGAPEAPKGSGKENQEGVAMGIQTAAQLGLMDAQRKNIEADTANKVAENPNIPKTGENITADTTKKGAETQAIAQNIQNAKAAEALTKAQTRIANIQGNIGEQSQGDQIDKIHSETIRALHDAHIAMNEAGISDETKEAKISILKTEAVNKILESAQIKASTANTKQNTASQAEGTAQLIRKTAADIVQKWDSNRIEESNNLMRNAIESMNIDIKDRDQVINAIRDIIGLGLLTNKGGGIHTPIGGFHKR